MASPIAIAAAMGRLVTLTCPHCGYKKIVARRPAAFRVCPRCKRRFAEPKRK
jgi:ribosomal protein S27E